jgi:hypothetical protein
LKSVGSRWKASRRDEKTRQNKDNTLISLAYFWSRGLDASVTCRI